MPQEQKKRKGIDPTPHREDTEEKKTPIDKELEDLIEQADKVSKRNKEKAQKKQPGRQ